ncbi:MAG: UDP-2,3-diacylglucosamine diphosphatase [Caldilineae bacterium]|nr:UDP-2,3-diacylglucosamine diphosphatase [Chloroflexota bacterium]MCB9176934.1 UDP-2,3-diacylglucosamine diphosphatase [Caldilineae bacterium]
MQASESSNDHLGATRRRPVDLAILSDLHLGTYGCHADELLAYLRSIQPGRLILNGDIIDIWQFNKRYWPVSHMQVIEEIVSLMGDGVPVYYLTGNHDDVLRRFSDVDLGDFHLRDKLLLEIDGKRHWIFHGDVFDASIHHMRWLARLGGRGYDALIRINRGVNAALQAMGQPRRSFSKRIKQGVKRAVKVVGDFERCAAELAIERGYDYVICGHIHVPQRRVIRDAQGRQVVYLNSGDWVESLTALEYHGGRWHIYRHDKSAVPSLPVARDRLPSGAGTPLDRVAMVGQGLLDLRIDTR